jgi:hypothetical protein
LIEEAQRHLDRLIAARQLVDDLTEDPEDAEVADDEPQNKPEAIIRVLELSGQDALSANSIFGALDTRGWLTDADRTDDKHFHKTLQKLYARGRLVKPRRAMYALPERVGRFQDPALNGSGRAIQEDFLDET